MNRIWLSLAILSCAGDITAAQVQINVATRTYKRHERIVATIKNSGKKPVIVCTEIGQTSRINDEIKTTPYPFVGQKNKKNKWSTLLIGPDVGSFRSNNVLKPGESVEFPFAINDTGE